MLRLLCPLGPGATSLDELAAEAAQHAMELRGLSEKGARARKKKALVDFLHALGEAGVSHRRLAVPVTERSVHSWFSQARRLHSCICKPRFTS